LLHLAGEFGVLLATFVTLKTRIFVVDDHALFRRGVTTLINAQHDMIVCGEGEDCVISTAKILELMPEMVISDITLKRADGIELVKNLRSQAPSIQTIVLSGHEEATYALRVLRAGAKGYIMKTDPSEAVVEAIRKVRSGQIHVSDHVASQMLNRFAQGEKSKDDSAVSGLSDRELEVLNLIGRGVSTRDIAASLHLSIKTVETHRAHIKTKLNLATSVQLLQFAVRWVDQSPHLLGPAGTQANESKESSGKATSSGNSPLLSA
jgi:DNA-binding NarL/FixJ family response regulator